MAKYSILVRKKGIQSGEHDERESIVGWAEQW